jgi:hypothetical protein
MWWIPTSNTRAMMPGGLSFAGGHIDKRLLEPRPGPLCRAWRARQLPHPSYSKPIRPIEIIQIAGALRSHEPLVEPRDRCLRARSTMA